MLYWLTMMIIMVIISNNDKLQIVSAGCIRRLIQTMIWLTVSEFYLTIWPLILKPLAASASNQQQATSGQLHLASLMSSLSSYNFLQHQQVEQLAARMTTGLRAAR